MKVRIKLYDQLKNKIMCSIPISNSKFSVYDIKFKV